MRKEISDLKRELARAPKNERGRRRYTKELRERVVQATVAAQEAGRTLTELSKDLGIRDQLLGAWVRKSRAHGHRRGQVKSVEVIEIGLHRRIHLGKAGSGHLVSFGLVTERHVENMKAIRCVVAKSNRELLQVCVENP